MKSVNNQRNLLNETKALNEIKFLVRFIKKCYKLLIEKTKLIIL